MEIKINIEDVKVFTCAAYVLDQDKLLSKIYEIRLHWELGNKLIPYSEFANWYKQLHYNFSLTPEVAIYWSNAKNKLPDLSFTSIEPETDPYLQQKIINSDPMDLEIEYLLKINGLPASYKELILKAIVCGEINMSDWETTYINKKFYHGEWIFDIPSFTKLYNGRRKDEIKRDRPWYWQRKKGETPLQIAKEATERGKIDPEDYLEDVKKALKRYQQFLKIKGHVINY